MAIKPEMPHAKNAYMETVVVEISNRMVRVTKSLTAINTVAITARSEAGIKLSNPGRKINKTPQNPIITAPQRRQPTFSLKNTAAPIVTINGVAIKIDTTDDRGVKASAETKNNAANSSHNVRMITGLVNRLLCRIGSWVRSAIIKNTAAPLKPRVINICDTGKCDERSLINKSSRAKPAMAKIMNKIPLKFSIFCHPMLVLELKRLLKSLLDNLSDNKQIVTHIDNRRRVLGDDHSISFGKVFVRFGIGSINIMNFC